MRALALLGTVVLACGRIGFARDDAQIGDGGVDGSSAIVAVQETTNTATGAENSIAFTHAVQADDTVVVCFTFSDGSGALQSVTDSLGNNYTVVADVTSNGFVHYIAVAHSAAGGSDAVAVSLSAAPSSEWELIGVEYAGLKQNPFDGNAYSSGSGTSMMTGSVSVSSSNELLLAYAHSTGPQVGAGFTLRASASESIVEDEVVFAPGNYSASGATTNGIWTLILATFAGR